VADPETLAQMNANGQVVLRYCAPNGMIDLAANPNGSTEAVAGICSAAGNVLGLMPHPERAAEAILGEDDGRAFLQQVVQAWTAGGRRAVESQIAR
jgi:phosphoribosylformylglycinamidine synthase